MHPPTRPKEVLTPHLISLKIIAKNIFVLHTSVFFKVFEKVSWWSFRVSTPFSLRCLVLLNYIHKNANFRLSMLNYLNTTFTLGKQNEDDFINRKVQRRPTYSF